MNLQDSTLVFRAESAEHPPVAAIAQSVYDRLLDGETVDYRALDDLIGEASGKGVLRAIRAKYGPVAFEAILAPIMAVIAETKPIRSGRPQWTPPPGEDPLAVRHHSAEVAGPGRSAPAIWLPAGSSGLFRDYRGKATDTGE